MTDFDPSAFAASRLALPPETRRRKAEVYAAALNEVGVPARPNPETGGVRCRVHLRGTPEQHYQAGVIAARAVGEEPISFEDWKALRLHQNPEHEEWMRREFSR